MDCFINDFEIYPFSTGYLNAKTGKDIIDDPQVALSLIRETFLGVAKSRHSKEKAQVHVSFISATDTQSFRGKSGLKNLEFKSTDYVLNAQICGMRLANSYQVNVHCFLASIKCS
jgi:hypothetical protein